MEARSQVKIDRQATPANTPSRPWEDSAALSEDHSDESLAAYQFQFPSPRIRINADFAAYAHRVLHPPAAPCARLCWS